MRIAECRMRNNGKPDHHDTTNTTNGKVNAE